MKNMRRCFSLVIAMTFVITLAGCPPISSSRGWIYTLAEQEWQRGESIQLMSDGGFFVVGRGAPSGQTNGDLRLFAARISGNGELDASSIFLSLYPATQVTEPANTSGVISPSGAVTLAGVDDALGFPSDTSPVRGYLRIMFTDASFNSPVGITYGDDKQWRVRTVLVDDQGSVFLPGETHARFSVVSNFLLKVNSDQELSLLGVYGDWTVDRSSALSAIFDSGFAANRDIVAAGNANSSDGSTDMGLLRVQTNGSFVWLKGFEKPETQRAYALTALPDGSFLLAGKSGDPAIPYLIKADADGNEVWARDDLLGFDPADYNYEIWDMAVDTDGSIVLVGEARKNSYPGGIGVFPIEDRAAIVIKLDSNGNNIWTKSLLARLYGVCLTNHNTYMTVGTLADNLNLIEVDRNGNVVN